jgi:hypothetical protein
MQPLILVEHLENCYKVERIFYLIMNSVVTKSSFDLKDDALHLHDETHSRGVEVLMEDAISGEVSTQKETSKFDNRDDVQGCNEDNLNETEDSKESSKALRRRQMGGAAVAGGVVGMVVAGPVVALGLAAVAAAAAGSRGTYVLGDAARKSGDAVASAGDEISKWDERHRVTEKTRKAVKRGCKAITKTVNLKHK